MALRVLWRVIQGCAFVAVAGAAVAQQPMGTVATHDALVTGGLEVRGESARLLSNASVTAYDHTAAIALERGGQALVCSTSEFHLLHSGNGAALLFGLDRGALELHTLANAQDVLLTPDIRFTVEMPGSFDLRLRVTRSGDTCVDNAGDHAPVLLLADPYSVATYRVMPGQHVLFEHGNLREVVDHERSPCGCPVEAKAPVLTASASAAERAAAEHPFPAAVSEGLAPAQAPANASPAGEVHTQVDTTVSFNAAAPGGGEAAGGAEVARAAVPVAAAPPPAPPGLHTMAHAVGHFFHKLFHPHSDPAATGPGQ